MWISYMFSTGHGSGSTNWSVADLAVDAAAAAAAGHAALVSRSTPVVRRSANPSRRGDVARRSTSARLRYVLNIQCRYVK
ncbi:hypothetical protein RR48_10286 [Papilio machaon]|uniref:Uncharacterized protein n=1 Tax=Papilio machaon TaxID=76193 RepID=A0A194RGH5_PAPMA|nr:hypothetical protein RR48_10286 [Papilio machaon]